MKKIKLTQGQFAIVDDADFTWLNQWKWCVGKGGNCGKIYAIRRSRDSERKTILMHREILQPGAKDVDHKNGDTLDNRRRNLRACSAAQNLWNRGPQKNNTSGFKGVYWNKQKQAWCATIDVFLRSIHLGFFLTAKAAGKAYKAASRKYHGEFARV